VRAWRRGDATHFLAVPLSSRNAYLLLHRLQKGAASHTTMTREEPIAGDTSGIGRQLFVRRTSMTSVVFYTAVMAGVLYLAWLSVDRFVPQFARLGHGAVLGAGMLFLLYALHRLTTRYRFHERGLTRSTILGKRTMLYGQVEKLLWKETTTLINHSIAVGTTMNVQFVPGDGSSPLQVKLHRFRAGDEDIEPVRRAVSHNIALHLREHLNREGRVAWTNDAAFTRDGLEVKTGLLGNTTTLLPYDQPLGLHLHEGYLNIHRDSPRKPIVLLRSSGANFYPGLVLYEMLMQQRAA